MPSENKTKNLSLNQWQGNEYAKRQDFVDDNKKIDDAIGDVKSHLEDIMKKINEIDSMKNLSVECIEKDSEGIFKTVQWKDSKNKLIKKSLLSGGTSPRYTNRIIEYYNDNKVIKIVKYQLKYDNDDILISEVIENEQ